MNLCRVVYYSERNMAAALDVKQMISASQRNNAKTTISGFLVFDGACFLQVLEGSRHDVSATYHRIANDPRHQRILLLACSDVRERLFPGWSMGLHESTPERTKQVYLRYFATDKIDPLQVNVESLLDVMQDLAVAPNA